MSSTYDYAVHSAHLTCEVAAIDVRHALENFGQENLPDHLPILVSIGENLAGLQDTLVVDRLA